MPVVLHAPQRTHLYPVAVISARGLESFNLDNWNRHATCNAAESLCFQELSLLFDLTPYFQAARASKTELADDQCTTGFQLTPNTPY